jgi:hypothetical protein
MTHEACGAGKTKQKTSDKYSFHSIEEFDSFVSFFLGTELELEMMQHRLKGEQTSEQVRASIVNSKEDGDTRKSPWEDP